MDWRWLLLAFGVLWAVQVAGTALQMRHYRRFLSQTVARWSDGAIGSGNARARFGKGVIAVLVVDPNGAVRQAFAMQGRTVWAKFRPIETLAGKPIREIRTGAAFGRDEGKLAQAFARAADQIDASLVRAGRAPLAV